jgi:respiratory burst oxidase
VPTNSLTPVPSRTEVASVDTLVGGSDEGQSAIAGREKGYDKVTKECIRKDKPGSYGVRRVDFHWSVREKNDLLWFSDLLNRASNLAENDASNLTLNINAHITAKGKDISTHAFRYLLDTYRTEEYPYSALTQLKAAAQFGRPDFVRILEQYYDDMAAQGWNGRVGIFFCGPPVIGKLLADQCSILTARAKAEGGNMRFVFNNEVF